MPVVVAELHKAFRNYVRAAAQLLSQKCPEPSAEPTWPDHVWIRHDASQYVRQPAQPRAGWLLCVRQSSDALHQLPEYRMLMDRMNAHPVIAPQMQQLVGTVLGQSSINFPNNEYVDGL